MRNRLSRNYEDSVSLPTIRSLTVRTNRHTYLNYIALQDQHRFLRHRYRWWQFHHDTDMQNPPLPLPACPYSSFRYRWYFLYRPSGKMHSGTLSNSRKLRKDLSKFRSSPRELLPNNSTNIRLVRRGRKSSPQPAPVHAMHIKIPTWRRPRHPQSYDGKYSLCD